MTEKLSESTWTAFTKKQKLELDDGALRKSLAKFDKTGQTEAKARLDALDDVVEQINRQIVALAKRRKELGDKPFTAAKDQLNDLLGEAEAQLKKARAAADDESEADSPALLTSKMVPLLRELRKGQAQMHAMICLAGKDTAVLIMRRPIAPSRRKLLATTLNATSGMKYIDGECLFDHGVLTFIVASPGAQLAKRLRQAVMDQTDLRLKVKVRGEDGVEEIDGEDESRLEDGQAPDVPTAPQAPSAEQLAQAQRLRKEREAAGTPPQAGDAEASEAFKRRIAALIPRIKQAQEAGHAAAPDAKLKASEAGVHAGKHDFAGANALLDDVEALLGGGMAPQAPKTGTSGPGTKNVAFAKIKLQWNQAKDRLEQDLEALRESVLQEYDDADTAESAQKILRILGRFNEGLGDTLDDLYNTGDGAAQSRLRARAAEISGRYQAYLDTDELVQLVERNPFMPLVIRERLSAPLQQLRQQLDAQA